MQDQEKIQIIKDILLKYCNPKKEFDHISPEALAKIILDSTK